MMTKDEKKELFLLILETWFNDNSGQINSGNCIGFYNHFLDCLEFEIQFDSEHEPGFHNFLTVIVDLLVDFPSYGKSGISRKSTVKHIVLNSGENVKMEKFDIFFDKLKELFLLFRDEYLV